MTQTAENAVLICGRSRLVSEALTSLFGSASSIDAVATTPEELETAVAEHQPAAVVLDLELASRVDASLVAGVPMLVIGQRREDTDGLDPRACVSADGSADALLEAVTRLLEGEQVGSPSSPPNRDRGRRASDELSWLTDRELEILQHLAIGRAQDDIAEALGVKPNTVRTHVQNLLGKLGASSRVDAVARAHEFGLLDLQTGRGTAP